MLPLSKLYDEADLHDLDMEPWIQEIAAVEAALKARGIAPDIPHVARYWEYAQALRTCHQWQRATHGSPLEVGGSLLEVGGSDSLFMPTAMALGTAQNYFAVELPSWLGPYGARQLQQCSEHLIQFEELPTTMQFDMIVSVSVIEHIEDCVEFFYKLVERMKPGGVLFLSSDIGEVPDDTYPFHWMRYMKIAGERVIWTPFSWALLPTTRRDVELIGPSEFRWNGGNVNGYSFGSMALRKLA